MSDRVCAPQDTVVGYMGGVGDYPAYQTNYTRLNYSETLRLIYDPRRTNMTRIMVRVRVTSCHQCLHDAHHCKRRFSVRVRHQCVAVGEWWVVGVWWHVANAVLNCAQ